MRAAGVRALGDPTEAIVLPEPPAPSADEVLIDVQAAGVGNWDDVVRTGGWDVGIRPPMALGVEAAGIVRVVGTPVTRFVPGDSVIVHSAPLRYQGAWAELFLADAADVARMPTELEWAVAGALPVPLLTALQVVGATACGPNDTVLVHGAGGVTGGLIVAMAAPTGASDHRDELRGGHAAGPKLRRQRGHRLSRSSLASLGEARIVARVQRRGQRRSRRGSRAA